jgi:DNA polymerase-1
MNKLLLLDGVNLLFRGYYALPLLTNSEGLYTNAVYGFLNMLFRFLDEEQPGYIAVAFDTHHPTFRDEMYGEYKGNRVTKPDEVERLYPQIALMKDILAAMDICVAECPGFEADDVIGTLAAKAEADGFHPVIVSGDRDMLQLVTDVTRLRLPRTKGGKTEVEEYFAADVLEKTGVSPRAYIDVKALMGDSSDNIPGVPGIGEVTATKIIAAYGSVENAIANASEIKPKKASENLVTYRQQALLSKKLAAINTNAPVAWEPSAAALGDIYNDKALAFFTRLELKNFLPRFKKENTAAACKIINNPFDADDVLASPQAAAFHLLTDGDELLGMGYAAVGGEPLYIPAQYVDKNALRNWFASPAPKLAYDSKSERRVLGKHGIPPVDNIIFDAMLAGYVLNEKTDIPALEDILENKGKKSKDRRSPKDLPTENAAAYAGGVAGAAAKAYPAMTEALTQNNQRLLYYDIELPLAEVLADMEAAGIQTDPSFIKEYGNKLDERLTQLTETIYECAGEEFNIQSPAQLGRILFDKLGLKATKKTPAGTPRQSRRQESGGPPGQRKARDGWSTAAEVLEKLRHKHEIIPPVLEYRACAKLKSTYADGLLSVINPVTRRVHSTFHQALTATGRLSSAEPNLQNIPVRMPLGRELRRAFIAPDANTLLMDADYSQIELRILAHMSGDENLIRAFIEGQDIHRLTAAQVLRIPPEDVTPAQRGNAKAVNFGIVYGISAFGLSEDLQITKQKAERYIQDYFEKYPKVKRYLDESVAGAKKNGCAQTLYNRRRAIPELLSSNFNLRGFGERVAMNMPIQGTAADIIKIAMVRVWQRLKREKAASRLILQVHDELLLEVRKDELDAVRGIVQHEMENAAVLSVPLVADIHVGESWYDTK